MVKLRHAVTPALLVTARGLTPRMEPVMQPQYTLRQIANFWDKVDRNGPVPEHRPDLGPCWLWTAWKDRKGYGRTSVWVNQKSTTLNAHRVAWEIEAWATIEPGLTVDHLCRVTSCVRPSHMELVPMSENVLRGSGPPAQNARKVRCIRGHDHWEIRSNGQRRCITCRRGTKEPTGIGST